MNKEKHIENSIAKAELGISKLNQEILNLEGFSSYKIRHLLNNLLELKKVNYLEVGTWKGSTFISSMYDNNINSAYAVDNWSEFLHSDIKSTFFKNTNKHIPYKNFNFFEENCFDLELSKISNLIDVYLYDGAHDYESHYKAIKYFYSVLADEFILIVDDYDSVPTWEQVQKGTQDSIKDLNLNIIYEKHLKSVGRNDINSWWNGYYIALIKK